MPDASLTSAEYSSNVACSAADDSAGVLASDDEMSDGNGAGGMSLMRPSEPNRKAPQMIREICTLGLERSIARCFFKYSVSADVKGELLEAFRNAFP